MFWITTVGLLVCGVTAAIHSRIVIRVCAVLWLVGISMFGGVQLEKLLFINRHIDLCVDETASYFREHGSFDPFCKVLRDEWST